MQDKVLKRIKLFEEGYSIKEVSEITKEKYKTVEGTSRLYRKVGGKLNKLSNRVLVNDYYFDTIDSECKAYLLGFFLADGCIDGSKNRSGKYTNRISLNNSIDDLDVIKLFQKEICPNIAIAYNDNQTGVEHRKLQARLRWSSPHMTEILLSRYNFYRQKAYHNEFIFPFEILPKGLVRHFIRGFFDGDGNVDFRKVNTKNGVETSIFQYGFLCNSYGFAKQLSNKICEIVEGVEGTIREIKGKTTNWFTLRFNTNRIRSVDKRYEFYKYLYKDSSYYLNRKKIKFDSFFEYRGKQIIKNYLTP